MGVKTLLTAGLTALAVVGGGAWAYVHYNEYHGGGSGCSTRFSCPLSSSSTTICSPPAIESCCPSADLVAQPEGNAVAIPVAPAPAEAPAQDESK